MRNFVFSLKLKKRKSVVLTLLSFFFLFSLGFNCSASIFNRFIKGDNGKLSDRDIKEFSKYERVRYYTNKNGNLQVQQYYNPSFNDNQFNSRATILVSIDEKMYKKPDFSFGDKVTPTPENAQKISVEQYDKYSDEFRSAYGDGINPLHDFDEPESRYGDLCPFSCEIC